MTSNSKAEETRNDDAAEQARVEIEIPVAIVGSAVGGDAWTERTVVENVTHRGAFIRTERRLEVGDLLAVHDADDATLTLGRVEIVWVRPAGETPAGVGVKLVDESSKWVRYLVERSAPDDEPSGSD